MRQCSEVGATLVGVQEARTSGPQVRLTNEYIVASSGATARRALGCEAWISRSWRGAEPGGTPVAVNLKDVVVVHAGPRIVLVAIRGNVALNMVVLHCPHSGATPGENQTFRDELRYAIGKRESLGNNRKWRGGAHTL